MPAPRIARPVLAALVLAGIAGSAVVGTQTVGAVDASRRISTSPTAVTDSTGQSGSAERGFVGGKTVPAIASTIDIKNTSDDKLYRTNHVAMTNFRESVPNGEYSVTLRMAETYYGTVGARVFDVALEGTRVIYHLDLVHDAGKYAAYDRTFSTKVSDGVLDVAFTPVKGAPLLSAIKITPMTVSSSSSTSSTTVAPLPVGVPSAANTGVPAGTVLTRHDGTITVTTAGTVLSNLDIHGFVIVKAPNVTIKNSIVRGGVATGNIGLVTDVTSTATNLQIIDSELVPEFPSVWIDGVKGWNFTVTRAHIHDTVDGVKIYGPNSTVQNSYIHDMRYYTNDPNQGGTPTHNDGVQILSGNNVKLLGNRILNANNSAVQVTQDHGSVSNLVMDGNWVDNGGCSININNSPLPSMTGVTVKNNKFGRGTRLVPCPIIATSQTSYVASGNVWADNGQTAYVRKG